MQYQETNGLRGWFFGESQEPLRLHETERGTASLVSGRMSCELTRAEMVELAHALTLILREG